MPILKRNFGFRQVKAGPASATYRVMSSSGIESFYVLVDVELCADAEGIAKPPY